MTTAHRAPSGAVPLREIARVFLLLGFTAFGGPAAHIARMEEELVRRRRWLDARTFLDLVAASQLLPGPNSTELAIHIGRERGGWRGLLVAGVCFIVPAALLVGVLAWAYTRWGRLPAVGALLYGLEPVVIAVVARALVSLAPKALRERRALAAALVALVAAPWLNELAVLLVAGLVAALPRLRRPAAAVIVPLPGALVALAAATPTPAGLFAVFLKIGSVLYGSGYVLVAFLRSELVTRRAWISEAQLLDAVAAGQITPGPLFTTATFVGYLVAGGWGAAAATLGIFLPAFLFVAVSGALVPRIRAHPAAGAFLDGVGAGSLALMAWVTLELARSAIVDAASATIALAALATLLLTRLSAAWVMAAGAAAGLVLARIA